MPDQMPPDAAASQDDVRFRLISDLEEQRGSRVVALVTGDRQGHETRLARDILPLAYDHLRQIGATEQIDLFLYTTGGDTLAAWGLINLIREYCKRLVVVVPFRCHSAGTLMALGADEVLLAPGAQLGPIDPSVSSPYNPPPPGVLPQAGRVQLLPVSVEDMLGYIHLVKNGAGISHEDALARLIAIMADKVHPLALGAVYRAREHVSTFARSLLASHLQSEPKVDLIVDYLSKLPSHSYIISRREAQAVLGDDWVKPLSSNEELLVWQLYKAYEEWLELTNPYSPDAILAGGGSVTRTFPRASLESTDSGRLKSHVFRTVKELSQVEQPVAGIQEHVIAEGWAKWPEN